MYKFQCTNLAHMLLNIFLNISCIWCYYKFPLFHHYLKQKDFFFFNLSMSWNLITLSSFFKVLRVVFIDKNTIYQKWLPYFQSLGLSNYLPASRKHRTSGTMLSKIVKVDSWGFEPTSLWSTEPKFEPLCWVCPQAPNFIIYPGHSSVTPIPCLLLLLHPHPHPSCGTGKLKCCWEKNIPAKWWGWLLWGILLLAAAGAGESSPGQQGSSASRRALQMAFWSWLQNKQMQFQNKRELTAWVSLWNGLGTPGTRGPSHWLLVTLVSQPWSPNQAWEWPCIIPSFGCCSQLGECVTGRLFPCQGEWSCLAVWILFVDHGGNH